MATQVDLGIIISIVGSAIAIVGVVIAMFFWVRSEANADRTHNQEENMLIRRELIDCVRAIEQEARSFGEKMLIESKDFHGRLCAIEERGKK